MNESKIITNENPFDANEFFNTVQAKDERIQNKDWLGGEIVGPLQPIHQPLKNESLKAFEYGITKVEIFRANGTAYNVQDWQHWLSLSSWESEVATCLLYGIDRDKLPRDKSIVDVIEQLHEQLAKLYRLTKEKGSMSPYQWLLFAKEQKLYIPKPILDIKKSIQDSDKKSQNPQVETTDLVGAGRERTNQLHCLIWRVYQHLISKSGKVTAQQVWYEIQRRHKNHDEDEIIQEVTTESIAWCSRHGNEQTLKRSVFDKTLSTLKANPPF